MAAIAAANSKMPKPVLPILAAKRALLALSDLRSIMAAIRLSPGLEKLLPR